MADTSGEDGGGESAHGDVSGKARFGRVDGEKVLRKHRKHGTYISGRNIELERICSTAAAHKIHTTRSTRAVAGGEAEGEYKKQEARKGWPRARQTY